MEFEEEFSFLVVVVSFDFVLFIYLSIFFITHFEIFVYMFRLLQSKMLLMLFFGMLIIIVVLVYLFLSH